MQQDVHPDTNLLLFIVNDEVLGSYIYALKLNLRFGGKLIPKGTGKVQYKFSFAEALANDDNKALGVSFAGYIVATGLITYSTLTGLAPQDEGMNVLSVLGWQAMAVVFLEAARLVNSFIILPGIDNGHSIVHDRNIAVGICEAGSYIGAGQVVMAALSGEPRVLSVDLTSSVMWFVLGQIFYSLHATIVRRINEWNFVLEIKAGNVAAATLFALQNIAVGSIASNSIYKSDSLLSFVVWFVFAATIITLLQFAIDKFIIPEQPLGHEIKADRNYGASIVVGVLPVGVSLVLNTFLPSTCDNLT